ncbi:transporter [Roseobacter sp.]|uniref:SphA family protein n=1 Tax=Roseobacter sp. TaxID=1907202 RepID=UPI00385F9966
MKNTLGFALCASLSLAMTETAEAVEGGIETYLLGSRDSFAGILPPAGSYWNNDFVFFSGSAPGISAGGAAVVNPEIDVFTYKFNFTHVFDAKLGSARFGLNINIPYVSADMDFDAELTSGLSGSLSDSETAFGDITLTPIFNWSQDKLHTSLALQFFLPTGDYSSARIDVPGRSVDVLNAGKNRFAFDPTLAMTWFDPSNGWEFTGAVGVTLSEKNDTTDYQTAPEAHFEGTVMRHFPSKFAAGLTGYWYQQLDDDSGSGADASKALLGANSLRARVFGIGPIVSWSTKLNHVPLSIKAKYVTEFEAKRRFESDKFWLTVGVSF